MNFWDNYWWIFFLIVLLVVVLFFLLRWYIIYHIDYQKEKQRHFPQWSNSGIISRDNYLLRTNYNFVDKSKCVVIGVHDIAGSKEDFNFTKEFFNKQQISFLSFDQRNCGENSKWKYHSLGTTVNDLEDIIKVVIERFPNQKIFLLGDSFGSALIALALKRLDNQIAGAILTNCIARKQIFKLARNSFFKIIVGFTFYKNMLLSVNYQPEDFSDQTSYIDSVHERNYRRNNKSFSLLYLAQAKKITRLVVKNLNASTLPVLVIQSGEDILADYDKITKIESNWRKEATYKFYKNGKHAILNDSQTDSILKDVNKWLVKLLEK